MAGSPPIRFPDQFSFQSSRSLRLLRLRPRIPVDRDAAPMPVARARVGIQGHRQSWQTGPTPALGADDRRRHMRSPSDEGRWSNPVSTESLATAASRSRCLKRVEQIASEDDPLPLPPRKAFAYEMINPAFHRFSRFAIRNPLLADVRISREQLPVDPGRSRRRDLGLNTEIRSRGERETLAPCASS